MTQTQKVPLEIQFAQGLAGNEQKNRDKTLALLKKFIRLRLSKLKEELKEEEFIKLWKGMHYQLWMQDKPLIQEKLVDDICQLVHDFSNEKYVMMFIKTFFDTEAREWYGLDQWRINKFMMLVREFLHNSLLYLKNCQFEENMCQKLSTILEKSVMDCKNPELPIGLKLHLIDIFLIELGKLADDQLSSNTAITLLSPFLKSLQIVKNDNVMKKLISMIFQASGGKECAEKNLKNSKVRGFVEDDPSQIKGNQFQLQFDKELLIKQLMEKGASKKCPAKNRNQIYKLVKRIRYYQLHPQKPIKIIREGDIDEQEMEVSEKEINAAIDRLKKNKNQLLKNVPTRKDYKRILVTEKKAKKASTKVATQDYDSTEYEDEDDDLEYDPELEFLLSDKSDNESCGEDIEAAEENFDSDGSLLNGHVEEELSEIEVPECSIGSKRNTKLQKVRTKRKNEEAIEKNVTQTPEKQAKKVKVQKKVDDVGLVGKKLEVKKRKSQKKNDLNFAAVAKEIETISVKKRKLSKEEETNIGDEIEPMFGVVDFPEDNATEGVNLADAVIGEQKKSAENKNTDTRKSQSKRAKKRKQSTIKKLTMMTDKFDETSDDNDTTTTKLHFPLPDNAKDAVDISNLKTQSTLQLYEHLKNMRKNKEKKQLKKGKKHPKLSRLDRYFNEIEKQVISLEQKPKAPNLETTASVNDAKVPCEKKRKNQKKKKKLSLVVKDKKTASFKDKKMSSELKTKVKTSDKLDQLYTHPPAFLRNAVLKAAKSKKNDKKSESKELASCKTSASQGEKKHVSFNMKQNKAFILKSQLENHPDAFHPSKKPGIGILKPSPSPIRISKKFSMDKKLSMLAKRSYMAYFM